MLPAHAPQSFSDRSILWNSVEQIEKARDSQLAREIEAALPRELSGEQQLALVRAYVKDNFVDKGTESILNGYEAKCRGKRSRDELARMMRSSTWLTAQEALDAGLADGILYQEGTEPLPGQIVNAVGGGIRALANGGGLPDAGQLRARYEALGSPPPDPNRPNQGGAPGPNNQDGWQAQAALDIEKFRF